MFIPTGTKITMPNIGQDQLRVKFLATSEVKRQCESSVPKDVEASLTETAGNIRQHVLQTPRPEGLSWIQTERCASVSLLILLDAEEAKERNTTIQ